METSSIFGNGSKPLGDTMASGIMSEATSAPSVHSSLMIPGKSCSTMGKAVAIHVHDTIVELLCDGLVSEGSCRDLEL
jgi:hypothetical protein